MTFISIALFSLPHTPHSFFLHHHYDHYSCSYITHSAFSYRRITFVIEVPIIPSSGFMVYSSFTTPPSLSPSTLPPKISAWNTWLASIKSKSRVSHLQAGHKTVFSLKGAENDLIRCDVFQKTLEYFVEMSLKLHNLLFPEERRDVENVSLTIRPVVAV